MSVTVTLTLSDTGEDFIGGRVGWSHTTSLTVSICTPRRFSSGSLFFRISVLSTIGGKYSGKEPKWNIQVIRCIYYRLSEVSVQKRLSHFVRLNSY